jgi:hypothetical protein
MSSTASILESRAVVENGAPAFSILAIIEVLHVDVGPRGTVASRQDITGPVGDGLQVCTPTEHAVRKLKIPLIYLTKVLLQRQKHPK